MLHSTKPQLRKQKTNKPIKTSTRKIKSKSSTKPAKKLQSSTPLSISSTHTTPLSIRSPQFLQTQSKQLFSSIPLLDTSSNTLKNLSKRSTKFKSSAAFKSTLPQQGIFSPVIRAINEASYESPQAQKLTNLPPLGVTKYLKRSNDDWEMCYDGAMGQTLIYLKKMSIGSFVLSIVSFPFIVTFPSETISLAGKWALAGSTVTMGVGSTLFTNVFCSAYVCRAFVNKQYPNIMELTTAGFTGKYESFRFDVTEKTTDNVERPLTSFKHIATDRHFFVAPALVDHPVWGMILPHLFDVDGEESAKSGATTSPTAVTNETTEAAKSDATVSPTVVVDQISSQPQKIVDSAVIQESHTVEEQAGETVATPPISKSATSVEAPKATSQSPSPDAASKPATAAKTPKAANKPPSPEVVNKFVDKSVGQVEQQLAPQADAALPPVPSHDSTKQAPKH